MYKNESNFLKQWNCSFEIFQRKFVQCSAVMDSVFCVYCILLSYLSEEKTKLGSSQMQCPQDCSKSRKRLSWHQKISKHSLFVNCARYFVKVFEGAQVIVVLHFDCQMNLKIANSRHRMVEIETPPSSLKQNLAIQRKSNKNRKNDEEI